MNREKDDGMVMMRAGRATEINTRRNYVTKMVETLSRNLGTKADGSASIELRVHSVGKPGRRCGRETMWKMWYTGTR